MRPKNCPRCGEKIRYLITRIWVSEVRYFSPTRSQKHPAPGDVTEAYSEVISRKKDGNKNIFACPECGATLFTNEDSAWNFMTKPELEWRMNQSLRDEEK